MEPMWFFPFFSLLEPLSTLTSSSPSLKPSSALTLGQKSGVGWGRVSDNLHHLHQAIHREEGLSQSPWSQLLWLRRDFHY